MSKKFSLSLCQKVLLMVYMFGLCTCWFCAWQALRGSMNNQINNIFEAACNEQFRVGNSIKTMMENKQYTEENRKYYLQGAIKKGLDSYTQYYSDGASVFRVSNTKGDVLCHTVSEDWQAKFILSPSQDGSIEYYMDTMGGRTFVFVSSYVKIYSDFFRFDYAQEVTRQLEEENSLSRRISMILFGSMGILIAILYTGINNALKPLNQLGLQAKAIAGGNYNLRAEIIHDDEVGGVASDFNNMAEAIQSHIHTLLETARLRELFAANLAHEIKTPITSIIGYSDLATRKELDSEELYYIHNYIRKEGKRIDILSQRLLEWSTLKQQKEAVSKPCNGEQILNHVLLTVQPVLDKKEQYLSIQNKVEMLFLDETLFVSLLVNLITNASKASYTGQTIYLLLKKEDEEHLEVQMIDYGAGIEKHELTKILEPFYMADQARDRTKEGFGLGLALCDAIVKAHNGEMNIESEFKKGTTITIRIPQPKNLDRFFTST